MSRAAVGLLAVVFCVAPASAQSPSRGVRLPFPAVSLGDDATGVDVNPAGLGRLRGLDAQLFATSLPDGVGGSGQAFYLASPVFGPLGLGLGVAHLDTQGLPGARPFRDYARLSLSAAIAPSDVWSFGLTVHTHVSDDPSVGSLTTLDLGVLVRPLPWLSVGAAVQDVTTPRVNGVPLHRAWIAGVGFRPGTDRLYVGADLRIEEVARRLDPVVRVAFEPVRGLLVGGSAELRERDGRTEITGQIGLTWTFDFASSWIRGGLSYASWIERGRGHDGFTVGGRFFRARERALPEPNGRFVKVHLQGAIPELGADDGFLVPAARPRWTTARVLGVLEAARRDERVIGALVAFDGVSLGMGQADEIRGALLRLRRAGKRVIAHIMGVGAGRENAVYLAATGADRIYLHPATTLNLVGFASSILFWKGLLDKVGVLPEFVAEGKYKSFPEPFTRKRMSEPNREATLAFLDDLYGRLVRVVAAARKKDPALVRTLIDRAPLSPEKAVEVGLADGIEYLDRLPRRLEKEGLPMRFLEDPGAPAGSRWGGHPVVAVVHVEGPIVEGKSFFDTIFRRRVAGAETVTQALRQAARDPRVRAVVLRIDSPGGLVTASDRIWREVVRTRKSKPVVASFGNVAASGGYYVAAGANEIFASPSTLTGSIGVVFGKVSLRGLFDKLDLSRETLRRGRRADLLTDARPWAKEERAVIRRLVKDSYERFLQRVSKGRRMGREAVHAVAQGRIWSGAAARDRKLVDRLGGLDAAIARAKELAGLSPRDRVIVRHLPRPGLLARLLRRLRGASAAGLSTTMARALRELSSPLWYLPSGAPWAVLPFEVDLR